VILTTSVILLLSVNAMSPSDTTNNNYRTTVT